MTRRRGTSEYSAWCNMLSRCTNPRVPNFVWYGARGVYVCARWRASFADFLADLGARPSAHHTLDRINNDGSYTCGTCDDCGAKGAPMNCRWATRTEQARNKRNNIWLEIDGQRFLAAELCAKHGVSRAVFFSRTHASTPWDATRAATTPPDPKRSAGQYARAARDHEKRRVAPAVPS